MALDRDHLLLVIPAGFAALRAVNKKEAAESFIRAILDSIADEGREPDDWEAHDLAAAIGFIAAGMYNAAVVYAERALTLPEQRSPIKPKDQSDPPASRQLREGLDHVGRIPARNW